MTTNPSSSSTPRHGPQDITGELPESSTSAEPASWVEGHSETEVTGDDNDGDNDDDDDDDDNDDEMDYEPQDGDETEEEFYLDIEEGEDEDEDLVYEDAEEGLLSGENLEALRTGGRFTISIDQDQAQRVAGNAAQADQGQVAPMTISRNDFLQMLQHSGLHRLLRTVRTANARPVADEEDEDDEDHGTRYPRRTTRRRARSSVEFPKVPSDVGRDLMEAGVFGTNERDENHYERKKRLASRLLIRELGLESPGKQRVASRITSQGLIPASKPDTIIHYDARCYSGQFSDDGNFFFSCSQDFRVRMYDTSNPYDWKYYRTVIYPFGQWTITDASLSPDNRHLAYSSIRSTVCLAPTDPEQDSEPYLLDFASVRSRASNGYASGHFGIWSIRFSGDGREIVAGTSDKSVYVYDIESRQTILRIPGHDDDVNAVCYGDKSSPHILYSGSDDTTLKVWDRRSLGDSREAGVFLGHTEGLTYVDSKGDGRYVLSNAKDQSMKLWDLRKMMSKDDADRVDSGQFASGFDYRFQEYDEADYRPHPNDCSLVTFRGHRVLKTLIRCHFSPPGSTDSRYVYSGSEDGCVHIYNMDATLAGKINVQKTTRNTRPRGSEDNSFALYDDNSQQVWKTCVRDASWHPNAPVIAATSWNGHGMTKGTCTVHTWNDGLEEDESELGSGRRVDEQLRPQQRFYERETAADTRGNRAAQTLRRRMLSALNDDDD